MACRTLLAWLDLRRDGAPGLTADLAEIFAVAEGTARLHLEVVLRLARDLSSSLDA
jgi:hypothetical protein